MQQQAGFRVERSEAFEFCLDFVDVRRYPVRHRDQQRRLFRRSGADELRHEKSAPGEGNQLAVLAEAVDRAVDDQLADVVAAHDIPDGHEFFAGRHPAQLPHEIFVQRI